MKKETFDFSEALRRMKEGKKVTRVVDGTIYQVYYIDKDEIGIDWLMREVKEGDRVYCKPYPISWLTTENILATDWEEVVE